ncbi:hypothetical protein [Neolewinella antarctica]|uniref:Lipoprotein n=1 Tax=Neolewinella antarctica TaxID=442734 RepID=A0ABX0X7Z7_9BACT|nr:hypothetical protein [Neolewinella antarctica]NJC25109.1 hypothetical protein [Neolewinella antarctica]
MTTTQLFTALLLTVFLCTCDRAHSVAQDETASPPTEVTPEVVTYASLPYDRIKYIFEHATYLDATFYYRDISINQTELSQIQATLAGISPEPLVIAPGCRAIGHIWFQVDGVSVEEADIYFQDECVGYVWYEGGKPFYANSLTEGGANFYRNIFKSVDNRAGQ